MNVYLYQDFDTKFWIFLKKKGYEINPVGVDVDFCALMTLSPSMELDIQEMHIHTGG